MVAKIRQQRIAERLREELSEMLLGHLTDPRLGGVMVTDVTVDRELAFATIYVSSFEGSERKEEILSGLESAKGYLRYHLSQHIHLRTFPQLRFKWDATPERAERIEKLLDSLRDQENSAHSENESDNAA